MLALVNPFFVSRLIGVYLGGFAMEFPEEVVPIARIPMVSNSSTSNYYLLGNRMNMFSRSSSVARTHLGQAHINLDMKNDRIVNSEEYSMKDIDRNLLEWNKWNIPTCRIYRQTSFSKLSFMTDYTIKTIERTYS